MYQKTITNDVSIIGVGLHDGECGKLTIMPAPVNHGVVINGICVTAFTVRDTTLSTNLSNVATIEHLMAAIHACQIDNLNITIKYSKEIPILDGSACPYYNLLQSAGVTSQTQKKQYKIIDNLYEVEENDHFIRIEPYDGLVIDMTIIFDHPLIGIQQIKYDVLNDDFSDIALARTFGQLKDIVKAQEMGLLKGGNLNNAIVLDHDSIINGELRTVNEFVKHKLIDTIGDLYVSGNIRGKVTCCCNGHKLNNKLMRLISNV